ncbi:17892_t:CDS:2, partial [Dentiscutata erythropus]
CSRIPYSIEVRGASCVVMPQASLNCKGCLAYGPMVKISVKRLVIFVKEIQRYAHREWSGPVKPARFVAKPCHMQ